MCIFSFSVGTPRVPHAPHESQLAKSRILSVASTGLSVLQRPKGTGFKDLKKRNIIYSINSPKYNHKSQ